MGAPVPYRVEKITPLNNLNPFVPSETLEHKEVTFEKTPGIFPRKSAPSVIFPYFSIEISQIMWQKIAQKCPKKGAFSGFFHLLSSARNQWNPQNQRSAPDGIPGSDSVFGQRQKT